MNYIADARREHNLTLSNVPLYNYGKNQLKFICNNARSFKKHYIDVKGNYNMLAANVICIADHNQDQVMTQKMITLRVTTDIVWIKQIQ